MFQGEVIGYLGADAETKNENGKEFTTCRVAHTDRWTDQQGQVRETTQWVDLIFNGRPAVADYLKRGTQIYARGHQRLRCYSSEQARGFVAGCTISVVSIELLGGKSDSVPSRLYDDKGGQVDITKYFHAQFANMKLTDGRGHFFLSDDNGWVVPMEQVPTDVQEVVNKEEQTKTPKKKK